MALGSAAYATPFSRWRALLLLLALCIFFFFLQCARVWQAAQGFAPSDADGGSADGATPKLVLPLSAPQLAAATAPPKLWAPLWAALQATRALLAQVSLKGASNTHALVAPSFESFRSSPEKKT